MQGWKAFKIGYKLHYSVPGIKICSIKQAETFQKSSNSLISL